MCKINFILLLRFILVVVDKSRINYFKFSEFYIPGFSRLYFCCICIISEKKLKIEVFFIFIFADSDVSRFGIYFC